MQQTKTILGIDPGTTDMGYGVLICKQKKLFVETMGVIELHKFINHYQKLKKIYERVNALVTEYQPDELAIEAPFFGKNVQSMLKLGRAQGVAMAAALMLDVPIFEYSPRRIKQAITGNGSASKEQVAAFLQSLLKLKSMPAKLDASDGLAAAVCHHFQENKPGGAKQSKRQANSWEDFIKKNPGRIMK